MKATGENIRAKCEAIGLSPKDLSRLLNLDLSTIYYWFQGKTLPRFDVAYGIAELCMCSLDDLIIVKEEDDENVEG